jgi:hypothetical protein
MKIEVLKEFVDNIPTLEANNLAVKHIQKRYNVPGGEAVKVYRKILKTSKNEELIQTKRKKALELSKSNPKAALKLYTEIDTHLEKLKHELESIPDADAQDRKWVIARSLNIGISKGCVRSAAKFETNNRQRAFKSLAKKLDIK